MIRPGMRIAAAAGAALSFLTAGGAPRQAPDLATLYENHQWFELRGARRRIQHVRQIC